MTLNETLINLLSRKMVVFYLALTALIFLTNGAKLTGENFLICFLGLVGSVIGGNVGEWIARRNVPLESSSKTETTETKTVEEVKN